MDDKIMEEIIKELEEEEQTAKEELKKKAEELNKELARFTNNIINAVFMNLKQIMERCNTYEDFRKCIKEIKLIEVKGNE